MEQKLAEYRAKKEREEFLNKTKEKITNLFSFPSKNKNDDYDYKTLIETTPPESLNEVLDDSDSHSDIDNINCCSYLDLVYYSLFFILWATVYAIFIKLEFGTIYFILSALVGIYLNTRTRRKKRNEISAYSVFNKNCESIDGTLKAEQLERQMIYGRLT